MIEHFTEARVARSLLAEIRAGEVGASEGACQEIL